MGGVVQIFQQRIFTLAEANDLLPLVARITERTMAQVREVQNRINSYQALAAPGADLLNASKQRLIDQWEAKVKKLGGHPKGLWMVDFDTGSGYFCWRHPEPRILFEHGYRDGFSRRFSVAETAVESDPAPEAPPPS